MAMKNSVGWIFGIALVINSVFASPGDRLPEFVDCVSACENAMQCKTRTEAATSNPFKEVAFSETPLLYKLLLWDCSDNCDYQCQQIITNVRIDRNEEVYQFHGKWPFRRLFGIQEFYSAIFSVGNFIPHYRGFKLTLRALNKIPKTEKSRILMLNYLMVSAAGMLAWLCSSIFHTRDLIITEKFDYFFAGATVLTGFHGIFYRVLRLDLHRSLGLFFTFCVLAIFSAHILRLYLDWSYTYNMRFNVFFGVLQYILLVTLAVVNYMRIRLSRPHLVRDLCLLPTALVLFTGVAMSSELFDFFNYPFQIDSHAIWHALTILPSFYLYDFFIKDYHYLKAKEAVNIKDI